MSRSPDHMDRQAAPAHPCIVEAITKPYVSELWADVLGALCSLYLMALPKKGTRRIHVEGVDYRYLGYGWRGEGDDFCELTIERAEDARQKVRARYTFTRVQAAYRSVGHALNHVIDTVPPFVARQTILIALKRGWTPEHGGGLLDLGNLDDAIDFSELDPDSQDPKRNANMAR